MAKSADPLHRLLQMSCEELSASFHHGLPIITKAPVAVHGDTKALRRMLEEAGTTPGLVEHVATPGMVTSYCVQQADLRGYYRMLTAWREETAMPETKADIDGFLQAVNEIEDDGKAVLDILVAALDTASCK